MDIFVWFYQDDQLRQIESLRVHNSILPRNHNVSEAPEGKSSNNSIETKRYLCQTLQVLRQISFLLSLALGFAGQFKKLEEISRNTKKGGSKLYDGTDHFHEIEAEHSPVSTCTNPNQQTEMEPGQNDTNKYAHFLFLEFNLFTISL